MLSGYFWIRYPIFSVLVALFIYLLQRWVPWMIMDHIWAFYVYFLVLMPGIYVLACYGISIHEAASVYIILGSGVLKMVLSLVLAGFVILTFHPEPRVFGFNFFVLYTLFSTFEIHCLLHNLRRQKI